MAELGPRRQEIVYCPVRDRQVEHVIVTLDSGEVFRWCQTCFEVLDEAAWEARRLTAPPPGSTPSRSG